LRCLSPARIRAAPTIQYARPCPLFFEGKNLF
jgi:hypothetical protein